MSNDQSDGGSDRSDSSGGSGDGRRGASWGWFAGNGGQQARSLQRAMNLGFRMWSDSLAQSEQALRSFAEPSKAVAEAPRQMQQLGERWLEYGTEYASIWLEAAGVQSAQVARDDDAGTGPEWVSDEQAGHAGFRAEKSDGEGGDDD